MVLNTVINMELYQYIIYRDKATKKWGVTMAPTSDPSDICLTMGPFDTAKEARIMVDRTDPKANWVNAKKAYTKIQNIDEDLPPWSLD